MELTLSASDEIAPLVGTVLMQNPQARTVLSYIGEISVQKQGDVMVHVY